MHLHAHTRRRMGTAALLAAGGLVLCYVVTFAFWFRFDLSGGSRGAFAMDGQIGIGCRPGAVYIGAGGLSAARRPAGKRPIYMLPRFYRIGPGWDFFLPLWIPAVAAAVPGVWMRWTARALAQRECASCGYDLAGNATGRCPECGKPIPGR